MKLTDMEAPPCDCPKCYQAGVTEKPIRRDPRSGQWLHGHDLRRWYEAKAEFMKLKSTIGPKVMP